MPRYLDQFRGTIGQNQFNKLSRLLTKQKDHGQFGSADEFRARLQSVMAELFNKRIKPLLEIFLATPSMKIDSETYNFMLERVQEDLEIAFVEALRVDEVLRSHQALMKDVVLRSLKHSLSDLENKISSYEDLVAIGEGFNSYMASDFDGTAGTRLKRSTENEGLFRDPRTGKTVASAFDCYLDQVGKFLSLPRKVFRYVDGVNIDQIFDGTATFTRTDVQPPGLKLDNLIDGEQGTYWARLYMFPQETGYSTASTTMSFAPEQVLTKLKIEFGGVAEINFVDIEPALLGPVVLDSMSYTLGDGSTGTVSGLSETLHQHRERIFFRRIAARDVTLVFTNTTSFARAYKVESGDVNLSDVLPDRILETIGGDFAKEIQEFTGRQFQIGFDNIRFGLAEFEDVGIFVMKPLELKGKSSRAFGLTSSELRPGATSAAPSSVAMSSSAYDDADTKTFLGSIEHWVTRRMYDVAGGLIAVDTFPVLPVDVERVNHERLILTHKYSSTSPTNDSGKLMFYTTATAGDIKVYKNGSVTALTSTVDWVEETNLSQTSPAAGVPMAFGVRIVNPGVNDIYTVSYDPVVSNIQTQVLATGSTQQTLVDAVGDLSCRPYTRQLVLAEEYKSGTKIDSVEVYLTVIVRKNTHRNYLSPNVKAFALMAGAENSDKFQGGFNAQ